jgi:uncharacterized damage-inducible protein DinB
MPLRDLLLPEWDSECAASRRVLERLPEDRYAWKPHEKSPSVANLAAHLANIAEWGALTLRHDEYDLAPPGAPAYTLQEPRNRAELLARFDKAHDEGRRALGDVSDEAFARPWTLKLGGKAFRIWPRYSALRGFVMNHAIHHRAQLSLYLRLLNVPVPSVYGPTADEPHT